MNTTNLDVENIIKEFIKLREVYKEYGKNLKKILEYLISGVSSEFFIQDRIKSVYSFFKKFIEHKPKYQDPLKEILDICGIRIVLPNKDEETLACRLIEDHFIVDRENSGDKFEEQKEYEFKYRAIHYIIQLNPNSKILKILNLNLPAKFFDLKAEIQVCTCLENAWNINQGEFIYKKGIDYPKSLLSSLHAINGTLQSAELFLTNCVRNFRTFHASYGSYKKPEKILNDIKNLEFIHKIYKEDYNIALELAYNAKLIKNWDLGIKILEECLHEDYLRNIPYLKRAQFHRELGVMRYKKNEKNNFSEGYIKGQEELKKAIEINPRDLDALGILGSTYLKQNDYKNAVKYFEKALDIDSNDPYCLVNYLRLKIITSQNLNILKYLKRDIKGALERRIHHVQANVDIPWAYFDIGTFTILLIDANEDSKDDINEKIRNAINYYLLGIKTSPEAWMIDTTLNYINDIDSVPEKIPGIKYIKWLLLLGLAFNIKNDLKKEDLSNKEKIIKKEELNEISKKIKSLEIERLQDNFKEPIIIIAGGTDKSVEKQLDIYTNNIIVAFKDFKGTIISGGTPSGIAGIVGKLQSIYPKKIETIGYMPQKNPWDIKEDKRYKIIHKTKGDDFSILEPFHYWNDLIFSDVDLNKIKLLGINGGNISAIEFRMASIFGGKVGIIKNSGRAADLFLTDQSWMHLFKELFENDEKSIVKPINNDATELRNFLRESL